MPEWSIIIHGGARTIKPEEETAHRKAASEAITIGAAVLRKGGPALDAVEASIKAMEDGGVFNAGCGSVKCANGIVEMDASIMDGKTLDIGAVAAVPQLKNPISVARAVLKEKAVLLAGAQALTFATERGFELYDHTKQTGCDSGCDTVGCVARDKDGNIAVGLSTGGLEGTLPGRVGDAPLPGCGFYADNGRGGLCMSGDGESIARLMLAAEVLNNMKTFSPDKAMEEAFKGLGRVGGEAGCILIDAQGALAWMHNSDHFSIGYQTSDDEAPSVYLQKSEAYS